jgi:O-antigen ligase
LFYRVEKFTPYFIGVFGFFIAVYNQNRAFTFAFLLAVFIIYIFRNKNPTRFIFFGSSILLTILLLLTFYFKTDSSEGRLLIYKISWEMFKDNWLFGMGLGCFKQKYLHYQANYFAQNNYTNKELLLADNTYFAFNDYWQFVIETGVIGFFILLILLYLLYVFIVKVLNDGNYLIFKLNIFTFLIAVGIAAFFTHVFEKTVFQFAVILCYYFA